MKVNFKQLGLVAAVAAVSAGVVGTANAQTRAAGNIGDLAIVPYYTTQDSWQTGLHVTNTSDRTQVVKIRFRRALDSADAFDFNVVLSPEDVWTGAISDDTGSIRVSTTDTSCTVPSFSGGSLEMPNIFNVGAQEGYLEVISMGAPVLVGPATEATPPSAGGSGIAWNAKHVRDAATGLDTPRNCASVRSNFEIAGNIGIAAGWLSNSSTESLATDELATNAIVPGTFNTNTFDNIDDALSVSYFIRDAATGIEFGGNAVHISNFSTLPYMTNQVTGLLSGDENGFDYPDLNGGPTTIERNRFDLLRDPAVLGSSALINDWSVASARNVSTDWVVTFPGQYTMLDNYVWTFSGLDGALCGSAAGGPGGTPVPLCDFRDIPVTAQFTTLINREEYVQAGAPPGSVVVSPQIPGAPPATTTLDNEVNVIEWTNGTTEPVLNSVNTVGVNVAGLGDFGWAALTVTSNTAKTQLICAEYDGVVGAVLGEAIDAPGGVTAGAPGAGAVFSPATFNVATLRGTPTCVAPLNTEVPMVGFVAWERAFPSNPGSNYGRMVDHSFR